MSPETLDNLGDLYGETGLVADAEKAYSEALTIRRNLAAHDPGAYRPDVAQTLYNLGELLYSVTGRVTDAEKAFRRGADDLSRPHFQKSDICQHDRFTH